MLSQQYVSLKRFAEARKDAAEEMQMLIDRNDELMKENEALKVLMKGTLNVVADASSAAVKMCGAEEHEWECVGLSTAVGDLRCKKCGTYLITAKKNS